MLRRKGLKHFILSLLIGLCLTTAYLFPDAASDRVDKLAAQWVKPGAPGFALAVVKDGKIIYKNGYGLANLEWDAPITPKTVFYMGSVSKQFVAFAVALLESRGKLSFNDDIRKYIPEMPDYGDIITLRHLIHHISGIRGYLMLMDLGGLDIDHYHTQEEVIKHILVRQKNLDFKPGERFKYSNSGYLLLAEIVKRVSGMSFREFARKNILEPLGMKHSRFLDNHAEIVKNRAISYAPDKKLGYRAYISRFDQVGSGGLYSTVEDLFLWDQNFYHGKVGGKALLETLLTRGKLNNNEEIRYAFGLIHGEYKGLKTVSHTGGLLGYRALLLRFPAQKFSVICISNAGNFNVTRLGNEVADIYLADLFEKKPAKDKKKKKTKKKIRFAKLSRKHLYNKSGTYRNPKNGTMVTMSVKDGHLTALIMNTELVLEPLHKTRFKVVKPEIDTIVDFIRKGKSKTAPFVIEARKFSSGELTNTYEPVEAVEPTKEYLQEYTGAFFSDELNVTYTFVVRDGKLFVEFRTAPETHLRPTIKDEFSLQGVLYQFSRNSSGHIDGFGFKMRGVTPLPFKRLKR
jgi:CubicO group peptidase (beta-lactamase class C family)